MTNEELNKLKYPIGLFEKPDRIIHKNLQEWIKDISDFPFDLEKSTHRLEIEEKNFKYRPGGWTIKQVVHHCADSHMNALIRFKWSLTEKKPTIKAYFEAKWAELPDGMDDDFSSSIMILKGIHQKWVGLLNQMEETDFDKKFFHPEHQKSFSLKECVGIYAWHGKHHLAHIKNALKAKGKF